MWAPLDATFSFLCARPIRDGGPISTSLGEIALQVKKNKACALASGCRSQDGFLAWLRDDWRKKLQMKMKVAQAKGLQREEKIR